MLKMEGSATTGDVARIGRCNINYSSELSGEARVNLPLELSLPADPYKWTKRQAQNWLCWLREANDLEELDITEFNVDGAGLCRLSPQLIEHMVGIRGGNIFRSSLDLLQSTAALVRHSPGAEQTHPPFETQIPTQHKHLSPKHISPEHQSFVMKKPFDPTLSPTSLGGAPESPALTVSPPPLSLHSSQDRLPLHYQTPGDQPSYNRSSVITTEDIARLQPVAGDRFNLMVGAPSSGNVKKEKEEEEVEGELPAKIERRRSSDSSVEGEEDKLNRNYFPNSKTESRRSASNGIDCGRQGVTLWQFILELLADESCQEIVAWTENPLEFKVINSKEMATRWGNRKNRPKMNYDKLSRALRYYYRKNLIQHVPGKRQVYFFVEHPESLDFTQLLNNSLATHPARARKQSAFTHVTSRGSLKRPLADTDMLSEIKRGRTVEPLSMLGYPGRSPLPQLLTLQSPFTQQLPKFFLQQGGLDLMRLSADSLSSADPTRTLDPLMISSANLSASNPCVITSAQLPALVMPSESALQKISVLDTGCVKNTLRFDKLFE
ncbi:hypothetical protein ACHWQZ_G009977 [Mnemiopsis leidyi]